MPKELPRNLKVREVVRSDIPSLADLLTASPDDGTLYAYPQVKQYPEYMNRLYVEWLRTEVHNPSVLIRVATLQRQDGVEEKVIGFSSWIRKISTEEGTTSSKQWKKTTVMSSE